MLSNDYNASLLNLKDVIITDISHEEDCTRVFMELPRKVNQCPACNKHTDTIHDYRTQSIKDISFAGKNLILIFKKRRYRCSCKKRFIENIDFLQRYARVTTRLKAFIVASFAQARSATSIALETGCSVTTALRYFDNVKYPRPNLPRVIAIDEFKGNADGHKFQCILADPTKRKILDILPSRKQEDLCAYFNQFPIKERNKVKYIVMDMSNAFKSTMQICFPKAKIIADKFHVCRLVTWAVERVRKKVQKQFGKSRRCYFKKSRWLILKRMKKLNKEQQEQLAIMLNISNELTKAYRIKEAFYALLDATDISTLKTKFSQWQDIVMEENMEEFNSCMTTFGVWYKEIMLGLKSGCTNGYVEGCNNKTKVLKRVCYGVRNFERFRNRLLYMANS